MKVYFTINPQAWLVSPINPLTKNDIMKYILNELSYSAVSILYETLIFVTSAGLAIRL